MCPYGWYTRSYFIFQIASNRHEMSKFQVRLRGGSRAGRVEIPAREETCASASSLAPIMATREAHTVSFAKRAVSFPVMLGSLLSGAVFVFARGFSVDPDLWWHIKNGQNILATHHWPSTDPYSFTVSGIPWLSYEWLGDVLLGAVERFGGLQGLDGMLMILGSAIIVALYAYAAIRCGNSKAGFVTATALYLLAAPSFSLRPQMLGYLFIILTLIVLEYFRKGKQRSLWLLPPLFLIWINTHGSWVIGLGVILVFLASGLVEFRMGSIEAERWSTTQRIRLEACFLFCLAVIPCTPYGTQLAAYPFTVASSLPINVANVYEWQSMPFHLPLGKVFLGLVFGFFLLQMALRFSCRLDELVLFLFGTVMACLHVRFLLLFVPFFAALFAAVLALWVPSYNPRKDRYLLNALLIAMVIGAMARFFPTETDLKATVAKHFPMGAIQYLRSHDIPGPMYNTYGSGGYLIWALPERKVFIDGRGDLYEIGGAFSDYLQVANLKPAAFAVLRSYRIQSCLLDRNEPLATVLGALPDWRQVYADDVAALFVRRNGIPLASPLLAVPAVKQED